MTETASGGIEAAKVATANILVADDDPDIRYFLTVVLESAGHCVVTVEDGKAAVAAVTGQRFDIVISDLDMPGLDGRAVLDAVIRSGLRVDVVLISGKASIATALELVRDGAVNFLEKPLPAEVLLNEVRQIMRRRVESNGPRKLPRLRSDVARIGRYEIGRLIGSGGMGHVHAARDPFLGRPVAVKTISLPEGLPGDRGRRILEEFLKEARLAASITHANVAVIHDFGEAKTGELFIVMELVQGDTLADRIKKEERLDPKVAIEIALDVARGLQAAHAQGVVHRDVKPANIIVSDVVKLVNFGIAKIFVDGLSEAGIVGSPGYLSPEAIQAEDVGFRSDQFSLGTVLVEMLSGKNVYDRLTIEDTLEAITNMPAPSLVSLGVTVPDSVERVAARLQQKDPAQRYDDGALIEALEQAQSELTS